MKPALCAACGDAQPWADLQVCRRCEQAVRDALRDAPTLWDDLGDPWRGKPLGRTPGGDKPAPMPAERIEARDWLKRVLVTWCQILEDEFDGIMPPDELASIAHYVSTQAGRLLASDAAEGLVTDCRDISRLWRVAWPARFTGVRFGCPCGATVTVTVDRAGDMIRCPGCQDAGVMDWWLTRIQADAWRPMNLAQVTSWLLLVHRVPVTYEQVKKRVQRADLQGYMETDGGRVLYDPHAVLLLVDGLRRVA